MTTKDEALRLAREALTTIAEMPTPEQDNMVGANMRIVARSALSHLTEERKEGMPADFAGKHSSTPCCGKTGEPYPVMWNPWNKVVQCHHCGTVYAPHGVSLRDGQTFPPADAFDPDA